MTTHALAYKTLLRFKKGSASEVWLSYREGRWFGINNVDGDGHYMMRFGTMLKNNPEIVAIEVYNSTVADWETEPRAKVGAVAVPVEDIEGALNKVIRDYESGHSARERAESGATP